MHYLLAIDKKGKKCKLKLQNIKEFGLDMNCSELLKETDNAWIVYHNEGNPTINIIYKNGRFMESLEIA